MSDYLTINLKNETRGLGDGENRPLLFFNNKNEKKAFKY